MIKPDDKISLYAIADVLNLDIIKTNKLQGSGEVMVNLGAGTIKISYSITHSFKASPIDYGVTVHPKGWMLEIVLYTDAEYTYFMLVPAGLKYPKINKDTPFNYKQLNDIIAISKKPHDSDIWEAINQ